jgi:4-amino-4-deoxy-L-arabinose transferase-like glycosyltransferase
VLKRNGARWFAGLRVPSWLLVGGATVAVAMLVAIHQPVLDDEPLFADPARSAATGQGFGSPILDGLLPGAEDRVLWQPPGYEMVLAVWFRLIGFGLWQGRLLSALALAVTAVAIYKIGRRWVSVPVAALAVAAALISPWGLVAGTTIRPDPLCAAMVALSIWLYLRWIDGERIIVLMGAALTASAAVLVHPIGAVAATAILAHGLLARRHRWRLYLVFALVVLAVTGLLWGAFVVGHTAAFIEQVSLQLKRKDFSTAGPGRPAGFNPLFLLRGNRPHTLALLLVALAGTSLVLCWKRLDPPRTLLATWLAVVCVAVTVGAEWEYTLLVVIAAAPALCAALPLVSLRGARTAILCVAVASVMVESIFAIRDAVRAPSVPALVRSEVALVAGAPRILIGPGAAGVYFGVDDRERLREYVPVPVPAGTQERVAAEQGTLVMSMGTSDVLDAVAAHAKPVVPASPVGVWQVQ